MAINIATQSQVLTSSRQSLTWSHRHSPDEIPCWFMRSRSMAISLSSDVKKRACIGESGKKTKTRAEKATVRHPQKRKIIWYECSTLDWMCPRP